jgi:hypothetical protein
MNSRQSFEIPVRKRNGSRSPAPSRKLEEASPRRAKQKAVTLEITPLQELSAADRKELLSLTGKERASSLGARVLLGMLAETGKTMRQVARESGFDVSVLSNIANGRRASGPDLWTLAALAEAMDLDLQLHFSKR